MGRIETKIENGKLTKIFENRVDFTKEASVLEKLAKSSIRPDVIYCLDGEIAVHYAGGEVLADAVSAAMGNPAQLAGIFEAFFRWYCEFREKTKLSFGSTTLKDFSYADGKVMLFDFTGTKPAKIEEDLARCVAQLCTLSYDQTLGMEAAKLFICVASNFTSWDPALYSDTVRSFLSSSQPEKLRYLIRCTSSAGMVFAQRDDEDFTSAAGLVSCFPQRIVINASSLELSKPGFKVVTDLNGLQNTETVLNLLKEINQPSIVILNASRPSDTEGFRRMLEALPVSDMMILENEARSIFPMVLDTRAAKDAFLAAVLRGETSTWQVLKNDLRHKTVK